MREPGTLGAEEEDGGLLRDAGRPFGLRGHWEKRSANEAAEFEFTRADWEDEEELVEGGRTAPEVAVLEPNKSLRGGANTVAELTWVVAEEEPDCRRGTWEQT